MDKTRHDEITKRSDIAAIRLVLWLLTILFIAPIIICLSCNPGNTLLVLLCTYFLTKLSIVRTLSNSDNSKAAKLQDLFNRFRIDKSTEVIFTIKKHYKRKATKALN